MTSKFLKEIKKLINAYHRKYDAMGNKRKANENKRANKRA